MKKPTWGMINRLKKENNKLFNVAARIIEQYKADNAKLKREADFSKHMSEIWEELYRNELDVNKRLSSIMSENTNSILKQYS